MTLDMTHGKATGLLLRFALPLMLSSLIQQMYTLFDSLIVGRLLGTLAFTATASASTVHWFPLHILLGAINGFGVILAQQFGSRNREGFHRAFAAAITLALTLGVFLTVSGIIVALPVLELLNTPEALIDYALRYLRMLWLGFSVTAILNISTSALLAMGDSRTPLIALTLSSGINIALDYVFLAWLKMDVEGAALATILAQVAAALWSYRGLKREENALPKAMHFRPDLTVWKQLLRMGVPRMLCNGVTTTGELLVQAAVNGWGVAFVTGMTASRRYLNLVNVINYGLEGSVATYVGQNWGAGEKQRIREGTKSAITMGIITSVTTAAVVILLAKPMILFFVPDGSAEVLKFGVESLQVMALYLPFLYLLCEYRAAIQGMGNALVPMLSGFLELVMRAASTLLLPLLLGRSALYYTDAAAWAATAPMLFLCYQHMKRKHLS